MKPRKELCILLTRSVETHALISCMFVLVRTRRPSSTRNHVTFVTTLPHSYSPHLMTCTDAAVAEAGHVINAIASDVTLAALQIYARCRLFAKQYFIPFIVRVIFIYSSNIVTRTESMCHRVNEYILKAIKHYHQSMYAIHK